ncbi:hypothetical protein PV327_011315 [Microctonus hyperodae]|uniref:Uncharacterized protein n=1 Tax=Microctonus hyperodae TaxID=165561 RepID=A0AA39C4G8_MICHY|nr:hypothetical protein PV327_011315 [Microctonus hyperodae]
MAGCTSGECANLYLRNLLRDSILEHITWNGSPGSFALKGTRLVEAFKEAMNNNKKFGKVNQKNFADAMKHALHCAKERLRKSRIATAPRIFPSSSDVQKTNQSTEPGTYVAAKKPVEKIGIAVIKPMFESWNNF